MTPGLSITTGQGLKAKVSVCTSQSLWRLEAWKGPAEVTRVSPLVSLWTTGGSWIPPPVPAILPPRPPYPHHQPGWEAHVERTSEQEVSVQVGPSPFSCGFFNPPGWVSEAFYSFSFTKLRSL